MQPSLALEDVETAAIEGVRDADGWREVVVGSERIRWRHDGDEHAHYAAGWKVEYWHPYRHEWRPVVNWSSRDWFVLGFIAASEGRT